MTKIGKAFVHLCIFLFAVNLYAAGADSKDQVKVQATVDNNEIGLGDTVNLTVSVMSTSSVDSNDPKLPAMDGLSLINSWNSSSTSSKLMQTNTGMQFETVRRQEYNYTLSPSKTGGIQIGAVEVVVDGKSYKTKPILVTVKNGTLRQGKTAKRGGGANGNQAMPGMPDDDEMDNAESLFQQLLQRRAPALPPAANKLNEHNTNEAFFVRCELDKTTAFEGEQITANWYIYARGNIIALDRVKFPDLHGFWKEIIEEVPALNFQTEVLNGVTYRRALLASHALFPIKAGTAVVDEYKIKATVQTPNGPFGFGPPYTYTRVSERVPITVKPLPIEGKPADFNGAVGSFQLQASLDGMSFPANQPFSLKLRFDGEGNAKTIELPHIDLPAGIELYDTKNESKFFKNGHSYKEFEVLLIPRQEGEFTLPSLSTSMFDPKTQKYYTRSSPAFKIKITPATNVNPTNPQLAASGAGNAAPKVQAPHLPEPILNWSGSSTPSWLMSLLATLAWLAAIVVLAYRVWSHLLRGERVKGLRNLIDERSKNIQKLITSGNWRSTGTEVCNLIYLVLGGIAGEDGGSRELFKLLEHVPPSVRREVGKDLQKDIDSFQILGFAPEEAIGNLKDPGELQRQFAQVREHLLRALQLAGK